MAQAPTDLFAVHAQNAPDRPAVIEGEHVFTFAEVNAEVNRLVSGLQSLGFKAGDRMVWCGPNSREVLVTIHAGRKLGLTTVPLSYRFNAEEMHYIIDNSEAALVIVDAEQAPLVASIRNDLPKLREVVVYRGAEAGFRTWEEVLGSGTDDEPQSAGEPATGETMIYTSGTTGKPKGAKRGAADQALVFAMVMELRMGGEEMHLTTGPLYHSGPNAFAFLSHMLGGTVVIMRKFDAHEWVQLVTKHKVTSTFSAPTQLKRIVSLPDDEIAAGDYSSMHTLIANAAPVPYALKQEVIAKLGDGFLFEVYGSTELGVDTILVPEDQLRKPGSCGKPYGGIEVKAVDENGNTLPPNEPGELFFRTALAMEGYHATEEQLAESGEGWKSVGDVGYIDGEGYVYISDRKKDMIISGGMNIYPAEIEAVLYQHPDVMDVGVFGIPDDEWGEKVHAVVQAKAGRTIDMADIEGFAAERLAGYKRPRSWEFRDELPRTESGKLLKRVLRDEHWKGRKTGV
ncbi:MAG TPA: AMP-binding protein [Acidimicrobiales bacterium]|nr:AMP-binding protein [Acidimicrobiales bacterium]